MNPKVHLSLRRKDIESRVEGKVEQVEEDVIRVNGREKSRAGRRGCDLDKEGVPQRNSPGQKRTKSALIVA